METLWATGDERSFLEPPTVRPKPELALRLLRDTKLQSILPAACLPPASPPLTGRFTAISQWLLQNSVMILAGGLLLFAGLGGYGLARGTFGLAPANPAGIIVLLAGLAALGFVWSKRSLQRESVEYGLQRELAAYFKSANKLERAAFHEHKADALQDRKNSDGSRRP